jgi:hypothetical protein
MITKQCRERQTMRFLSSSPAFSAALKTLDRLRFPGVLKLWMYTERHGENMRFMESPPVPGIHAAPAMVK